MFEVAHTIVIHSSIVCRGVDLTRLRRGGAVLLTGDPRQLSPVGPVPRRWPRRPRWAGRVLRLAAGVLPPGHAERYLEEWRAELHDTEGWWPRTAYCARVLASVPSLIVPLLRRRRATE